MAIFAAWIQRRDACAADPLSITRSCAGTGLHHCFWPYSSECRIADSSYSVDSSFGSLCRHCFPAGGDRADGAPAPTEVVALPVAGDLFERPGLPPAILDLGLHPARRLCCRVSGRSGLHGCGVADAAPVLATHPLGAVIVPRVGWRINRLLAVCRPDHYVVGVSVLVSV